MNLLHRFRDLKRITNFLGRFTDSQLRMIIIMDFDIVSTESGGYASVRKELDSGIIPVPGMYVEDTAWKEPRKPTMITCSFENEYYHLRFQSDELKNDGDCKRACEMYKLHGWQVLG